LSADSNTAFVTDKHGQTIFFPWRRRGKGYIVPDLETKRKLNILALGFIWGIFLFPFLILLLSILVLFLRWNYYVCIGIFVGVPANLFVLYYAIVDAATKNLTVYSMSYRDLILDNLSSDD
jgi:hypothetical protein